MLHCHAAARHAPGWLLALALLAPGSAEGQVGTANGFHPVGERYRVEVAGTIWNPTPYGLIASDSLDAVGNAIDFATDLGFEATRLKDLRIVLRPSRRVRLRLQHTPVRYAAETSFSRTINFGGTPFPVSVPIVSTFSWRVWRGGVEYDFVHQPRGFVGVLVEARYTQLEAALATNTPFFVPPLEAGVVARAPLPAVGIVGRLYVAPNVAVNLEVSGFRVPRIADDIEARYLDWDLHGTVNLNEVFGVQVGWRHLTTYLSTDEDLGDLKFRGVWFGGALRY